MATTWNPSDVGGGVLTFTNGNSTASAQTSGGTWAGTRSTTSKTTGKFHFEFTIDSADVIDRHLIGICDSTFTLDSYAGSDLHSAGMQWSRLAGGGAATVTQRNNGTSSSISFSNTLVGDVIEVEVDVDNQLMWMQNVTHTSGWTNTGSSDFTGSPASGTGGFSFSSSTGNPVFICFTGQFFESNGADTITLNPGPSFAGTISSGFTAWDASDVLMGQHIICL